MNLNTLSRKLLLYLIPGITLHWYLNTTKMVSSVLNSMLTALFRNQHGYLAVQAEQQKIGVLYALPSRLTTGLVSVEVVVKELLSTMV